MNKTELAERLYKEFSRRIGWMKWQIRMHYAGLTALTLYCILTV